MSRERISMKDGTVAVVGYDEPFDTWYFMHYDRGEDENPRVAIGMHPAEQVLMRAERSDIIFGPYPCEDAEEMLTKIVPELAGPLFNGTAGDPQTCVYCKEPTMRPSPGCRNHPWEKLRYG